MGGRKVDKCGVELDDAKRKVEMSRDSLATDMMTFLAKDAELAGMIRKFLDHKLEYHQSLTDQVRSSQSVASVFPPNSFYRVLKIFISLF